MVDVRTETCNMRTETDDTPRLVLADLLRESDDPEMQARGRFLFEKMNQEPAAGR